MLDDLNLIKNRDPSDALSVAANEAEQTLFDFDIINSDHDGRAIMNVVVSGMGGSALAALQLKAWLKQELSVPFEIVRSYDLPDYVGENTLVIASSYSGNTEETVSSLGQAKARGAQIGVIAAGGELIEEANRSGISYVQLPGGIQPRMAVIYNLRALVGILANFDMVSRDKLDEIASVQQWLNNEVTNWSSDVPLESNYAKQLAMNAVGKTPVFYAGTLMAPVAYKWKISWNENAKNVSFWNEIPEFNHNEFLGWTSHPVEKPFAIFDLVSDLEHPQILKRFEISDRLLSGMRPKSTVVNLAGKTALQQILWGSILADFVSIYVAILNNVDPTPVPIIEKLKVELV